MRAVKVLTSFAIALATLFVFAASAAFAADAEAPAASTIAGLPSPVFWTALVTGAIAFFIGSIPPNRGEMAADEFDLRGALVWGAGIAMLCGSLVDWYIGSDPFIPICAGIVATAVILLRVMSTGGLPRASGIELVPGINRPSGDTVSRRNRNALRMYKRACFRNGNYYATRSRLEYRFEKYGMSKDVASTLTSSLRTASKSRFDILVLLVEYKTGEYAVIVVRGAEQLQQAHIYGTTMNVNGLPPIALSSVRGCVAYAWR